MISKRPWKLVPLAAMFALGLFMFAGGLSPSGVRATVDSIDAPESVAPGDEVTVTIDTEDDAGDLVITVTGGDAPEFNDIECSITCDSGDIDGEGTDSVTIDTIGLDANGNDTNMTVTLTLLADCADGDTLTIEANDVDSGSETWEIQCLEVNVTIIKEAPDDDSLEFDFTIEGDASCDEDFTMVDGDETSFSCDESETYTVTEDLPSGWTVTIECSDSGIPNADIVISDEDGAVEFTLGPGDSIICTFANEKGAAGPGAPNTVTVSAAPNAVNCNSISFVSIVVKDAAGLGVADGTAVTVGTNIGSLNQTATTTTGGGGGATVIFTSPSNSGGTATITATSGGKTGSAPIQVTCSPATAVPPTVAVQATATPRPATGTVSPPSTGDAGLAADGGSSWPLTAIALLVTGSLLGGLVVARRRA